VLPYHQRLILLEKEIGWKRVRMKGIWYMKDCPTQVATVASFRSRGEVALDCSVGFMGCATTQKVRITLDKFGKYVICNIRKNVTCNILTY
jgi:hypothetical protein